MRISIFLLLSLFAFGAQATETLTVFLIHGLGGSEGTFCRMPDLLKRQFGDDINVVPLTYKTEAPDLGPLDFTKEIHDKILAHYSANNLSQTAPYSLIMHSQGGIIGRQIAMNCLTAPQAVTTSASSRSPQKCDVRFPTNLKHFITLGTPHWGSTYASRLADLDLSILNGIPLKQIEQLEVGSTTLVSDRIDLLSIRPKERRLSIVPSGTRFVSIAGNISEIAKEKMRSVTRHALNYLTNIHENEDDIVVPLAFGQPDFIYHIEPRDQGTALKGQTHFADESFVVQQPHVQMYSFKDVDGIACVSDERDRDKRHLSYQLIVRELNSTYFHDSDLLKSNQRRIDQLSDSFNRQSSIFASELVIQLPESFHRDLTLASARVDIKGSQEIETTVLDNSWAAKAQGFNTNSQDKAAKRFFGYFHSGRFKRPLDLSGTNGLTTSFTEPHRGQICYSISVPGFEKKDFCVDVEPSRASFSRVILSPITRFATPSVQRLTPDHTRYIVGAVKIGASSLSSWKGNSQAGLKVYTIDLATGFLAAQDLPSEEAQKLNVQAECYVGRIAKSLSQKRGAVFNEFPDTTPAASLKPGVLVEIRGRHTQKVTSGKVGELDRYFITATRHALSTKGLIERARDFSLYRSQIGWINRVDIDIDPTLKCSF